MPSFQLAPDDEHNRALRENTGPEGWANPEPRGRYNLVVIGAGTAGLVAAAGAAGLGARVALVERHLMGGDCLNYGCVPSKGILRAARAAADVGRAGEFGVVVPEGTRVDFPAVMERMRRLRARISGNDSAARFRGLGVDVFLGEARFVDRRRVEVGGRALEFKKAIVATGARADVPPIEGLKETGFLTNETVFSLTELPPRLAVIGGGPIGCELGQAFARFGSKVTLFQSAPHVLPREDRDAAARIAGALRRDGVEIREGCRILRVEAGGGDRVVSFEDKGGQGKAAFDRILVAAGRAPNVEGMGLEKAGVEFDARKGIFVDDRLRTTNRRIFAAGDVCSIFQFTHAADFMARIVIRNALFMGRARAGDLVIPWCTYTDPEVAHVGMYERDAKERGIETATFTIEFADVDRAILDGEEEGFLKIHAEKGTDRILGATLVARHAGEMISEITLAIRARAGLSMLSGTIHPYPTQAEAFRKAGDTWQKNRLTPLVKSLLGRWLSWTR